MGAWPLQQGGRAFARELPKARELRNAVQYALWCVGVQCDAHPVECECLVTSARRRSTAGEVRNAVRYVLQEVGIALCVGAWPVQQGGGALARGHVPTAAEVSK